MNLSSTSEKILVIFFTNPDRKFYVNELIRQTGQYPNSVQQALKSLEKQKILVSFRQGRFKFYGLSSSCPLLTELQQLLIKKTNTEKNPYSDGIRWVKVVNRMNEIPYVCQVFSGQRDTMEKFLGFKFENFWYNGITGGVYYYKDHLLKGGEIITQKIKRNNKFLEKIVRDCLRFGEKFVGEAKKVNQLKPQDLSNQRILQKLENLLEHFSRFSPFLLVPLSIETIIDKELDLALRSLEDLGDFDETKRDLVKPTFFISEEQVAQLELAEKVKKLGWVKETWKELDSLTNSFSWLPMYSLLAEPFSKEYFKGSIENILKKINSPKEEIKALCQKEKERQKELEKTLEEIKASSYLRDLVALSQSYIKLRTYRVNVFRKFNYYHLPILYEIAARMELTNKEIKFLTYEEMKCWLRFGYGKKFGYFRSGLKKEVVRRMEGWAALMWKGKIKVIAGAKDIIEIMERYQIFTPGLQMIKTVKGSPACLGKVTGRVKVVRKLSELNKVEKGDILVAKMTTPDYMMAIHRAVAIVTDEGGITCHAAIVSREFNIPCIVATKNATQVLSDGDLVEVNADEGVVRVIEAVEAPEDIKVLSGKTIYKGKVSGTARIVLSAADFEKIKEGDILIAAQTTPEYLSPLYRVKGFVADEDSLTSHAVLYGQALRLPSIMGTGFARNVIKDGEKIELDATKGLVTRLDLS